MTWKIHFMKHLRKKLLWETLGDVGLFGWPWALRVTLSDLLKREAKNWLFSIILSESFFLEDGSFSIIPQRFRYFKEHYELSFQNVEFFENSTALKNLSSFANGLGNLCCFKTINSRKFLVQLWKNKHASGQLDRILKIKKSHNESHKNFLLTISNRRSISSLIHF